MHPARRSLFQSNPPRITQSALPHPTTPPRVPASPSPKHSLHDHTPSWTQLAAWHPHQTCPPATVRSATPTLRPSPRPPPSSTASTSTHPYQTGPSFDTSIPEHSLLLFRYFRFFCILA